MMKNNWLTIVSDGIDSLASEPLNSIQAFSALVAGSVENA
jgi:hypothetical protein